MTEFVWGCRSLPGTLREIPRRGIREQQLFEEGTLSLATALSFAAEAELS